MTFYEFNSKYFGSRRSNASSGTSASGSMTLNAFNKKYGIGKEIAPKRENFARDTAAYAGMLNELASSYNAAWTSVNSGGKTAQSDLARLNRSIEAAQYYQSMLGDEEGEELAGILKQASSGYNAMFDYRNRLNDWIEEKRNAALPQAMAGLYQHQMGMDGVTTSGSQSMMARPDDALVKEKENREYWEEKIAAAQKVIDSYESGEGTYTRDEYEAQLVMLEEYESSLAAGVPAPQTKGSGSVGGWLENVFGGGFNTELAGFERTGFTVVEPVVSAVADAWSAEGYIEQAQIDLDNLRRQRAEVEGVLPADDPYIQSLDAAIAELESQIAYYSDADAMAANKAQGEQDIAYTDEAISARYAKGQQQIAEEMDGRGWFGQQIVTAGSSLTQMGMDYAIAELLKVDPKYVLAARVRHGHGGRER